MKSIGFDKDGDEHLIDDRDNPKMHKADSLCGCNPDPYHDENPYDFSLPSKPVIYWWSHTQLTFREEDQNVI